MGHTSPSYGLEVRCPFVGHITRHSDWKFEGAIALQEEPLVRIGNSGYQRPGERDALSDRIAEGVGSTLAVSL